MKIENEINKWIRFKDELPDIVSQNDTYLIYCELHHQCFMGHIVKRPLEEEMYFIFHIWPILQKIYTIEINNYITHWMKIPSPPELSSFSLPHTNEELNAIKITEII